MLSRWSPLTSLRSRLPRSSAPYPHGAFQLANFPPCDPRRPLNCKPPSGPPLTMSSLSVTIHQAATIKPHLFPGAFQQKLPPTAHSRQQQADCPQGPPSRPAVGSRLSAPALGLGNRTRHYCLGVGGWWHAVANAGLLAPETALPWQDLSAEQHRQSWASAQGSV